MSTLFMVNIPHNCTDLELQEWIRSSGVPVKSVRLIRDLVSGASPSFAYVDIVETTPVTDAVKTLNGQSIRERVILVTEAQRGRTAA